VKVTRDGEEPVVPRALLDNKYPRLPNWVPGADDLNDVGDASRSRQEVMGPNTPLPIILGIDKVPAKIGFVHVDDANGYLYLLAAFGETSNAFVKLYVDGVDVDDLTTGLKSQPTAVVELYPQGGVSTLLSALVTGYTDDIDACYAVLRIPKAFSRSFPKIEAIIEGKELYDPRTDTTVYSDNPVLGAAYVATRAGWEVDWDSVELGADFNDELVGGEPRRRIGLTLQEPREIEDWAKVFRVYTGCFINWEGGVVRFVPDRAEAMPAGLARAFGPDDIVAGSLRVKKRSPRTLPTTVIVEYRDASNDASWVTERAVYESPGEVIAPRVSRVSLPGIHWYAQAYREAKERLNRLMLDLQVEFTAFDEALELQVGSIISLTHPLGFQNKLLRVIGLGTTRGRWAIQAEPYDETIYSNDAPTAPAAYESSLGDYTSPIVQTNVQVNNLTVVEPTMFSIPPGEVWDTEYSYDDSTLITLLVKADDRGVRTYLPSPAAPAIVGTVSPVTTPVYFEPYALDFPGTEFRQNYVEATGDILFWEHSEFTLEMVVYVDNNDYAYAVIASDNTTSTLYLGDFIIWRGTDQCFHLIWYQAKLESNVDGNDVQLVTGVAAAGTYHHLALQVSANGLVRLYLNGVGTTADKRRSLGTRFGGGNGDFLIGSAGAGWSSVVPSLRDLNGKVEAVRAFSYARYAESGGNITPPAEAFYTDRSYLANLVTDTNIGIKVFEQEGSSFNVRCELNFNNTNPQFYGNPISYYADRHDPLARYSEILHVYANGFSLSQAVLQAGDGALTISESGALFDASIVRTPYVYAEGRVELPFSQTGDDWTLEGFFSLAQYGDVANSVDQYIIMGHDYVYVHYVGPYNDNHGRLAFVKNGTNLEARLNDQGTWRTAIFYGFTSYNTYVHIALEMYNNVLTLYVNGVAGATTASGFTGGGDLGQGDPQSIPRSFAPALLLGGGYLSGYYWGLNGRAEELRFTKAARYKGAFTPPSTQFADTLFADGVSYLNAANIRTTALTGIEAPWWFSGVSAEWTAMNGWSTGGVLGFYNEAKLRFAGSAIEPGDAPICGEFLPPSPGGPVKYRAYEDVTNNADEVLMEFSWYDPAGPSETTVARLTTAGFEHTGVPVQGRFASVNTQAGVSYDLQVSDVGKYVRFTNSSAIDCNVPPVADEAFPLYSIITVRQAGSGQVSLVPGTGVTINTVSTLDLRAQGSTATLVYLGSDVWDVTGDLN
jgi:hypothetical protein